MSAIASHSKSGAILTKIGFCDLFSVFNAAKIELSMVASWSDRKPGVLGEETFTTK